MYYVTLSNLGLNARKSVSGVYAQGGKVADTKKGRLKAVHKIFMGITLLIMENHEKIMKLCFRISVGTLLNMFLWRNKIISPLIFC